MKVTNHSADYVEGNSTQVAQRKMIHDNIVTWHRERRKRESRHAAVLHQREVEQKKESFNSHFNAVGDAFTGKRVMV